MTNLKHIWMLGVFTLLFSFTLQAHHGKRHHRKKKNTRVVVVHKPVHRAHVLYRLPVQHRTIVHNHVTYYCVNSTYYVYKGGQYVVVTPPKAVLIIK